MKTRNPKNLLIEEIHRWAKTVIKDATERKMPVEAMLLLQMELAELQFILAKYERES